jgi:hypothetical protein
MQIHDIDWRTVLNAWDIADLLYLRSIIDEKIATGQKRRIIIRKQEP